MAEIQYYCTDLESTGLSASAHEVTEIGIIRAKDKVQLWKNVMCEHPETASIDALTITNKTMADLSNGMSKRDVVELCNKFFNEDGLTPGHRCIVGHNIYSFDRRFLFALWASVGKEFPATLWLDTIPMTKQYAKSIGLIKPKVNLHAACDILGIKKIAAKHNAKSDSQNSYLLWKALCEEKNMNYLPFIKTSAHILDPNHDGEGLDPDLLD
jgi:DNA polymerase III alpha subunit (gram-positive type)